MRFITFADALAAALILAACTERTQPQKSASSTLAADSSASAAAGVHGPLPSDILVVYLGTDFAREGSPPSQLVSTFVLKNNYGEPITYIKGIVDLSKDGAHLVTNHPIFFARTIPVGGTAPILVKFPFTRDTLPYRIEGATANLRITSVGTEIMPQPNQNVIDAETYLAEHAPPSNTSAPAERALGVATQASEIGKNGDAPRSSQSSFDDHAKEMRSFTKYLADQANRTYHKPDCPAVSGQRLPEVTKAAAILAGLSPHACVQRELPQNQQQH